MNFRHTILFLLLIAFFTGNTVLYAQRKSAENLLHFDDRKFHFGFYLALNTMDYRFTHYKNVFDNPVFTDNPSLMQTAIDGNYYQKTSFRGEVYPPSPGFTVGGVANLMLARDFDLRFTPGMSLGSRKMIYSIPISQAVIGQINGVDETSYLTTPSAYVDIPIGIRYKGFRHYNLRPYVYLGGAFRKDLENKRISESAIHLKKNSSYAEIALGLDSYLEYFRFTGELKFSYGLNNIIRHDTNTDKPIPWYGYVFKEVNSNILTLILYFE